MAEQKQKKAGLTISLGRRPKVLLLGNGMNRVYGGASWAGLLEKISRPLGGSRFICLRFSRENTQAMRWKNSFTNATMSFQ